MAEAQEQVHIWRRRRTAEIPEMGSAPDNGSINRSSIAHEVSQPLASTILNANSACNYSPKQSPDMDEMRAILKDVRMTTLVPSEMLDGIRSKSTETIKEQRPLMTVNNLIGAVLADEFAENRRSSGIAAED